MKGTTGLPLAEIAMILGFSFYGSLAHTLMANRATGKRGFALLGLVIVNTTISGFAGLMGYLFSKHFGLGLYETYMIAGMAGFMGGKFLEIMEVYISRRINANAGPSDT